MEREPPLHPEPDRQTGKKECRPPSGRPLFPSVMNPRSDKRQSSCPRRRIPPDAERSTPSRTGAGPGWERWSPRCRARGIKSLVLRLRYKSPSAENAHRSLLLRGVTPVLFSSPVGRSRSSRIHCFSTGREKVQISRRPPGSTGYRKVVWYPKPQGKGSGAKRRLPQKSRLFTIGQAKIDSSIPSIVPGLSRRRRLSLPAPPSHGALRSSSPCSITGVTPPNRP